MGKKSSTLKKKKIFIVDDHPVVCHAISNLINHESDLIACGEADNPQDTLRAIPSLKPDLVLIDLSIKEGNGLDLIKKLHALYPNLYLLALSMMDENFYAEPALRAGSRGYIMKQEATEKVISGIRQVLRDEICLSPPMISKLLSNIPSKEGKSSIESLSARESSVFELIGQGYSITRIAKKLRLSIKTIETYRQNIKNKIKVKDNASLMMHAFNWLANR